MPIDFSDPTGFNAFWEGVEDQFRAEAIDDHLGTGGNLSALNDHITGAVDADTLASQYSFPVVWSTPTNHSPAYATISTDQGTFAFSVVVFAADQDPEMAFDKARTLGGRIVNNVEGSALVDDDGNAHASKVELADFQTDSRPVSGKGAAVKFAELTFNIQVERPYTDK